MKKDTSCEFIPKTHYHLCGDHEKSEVGCVEGTGSCENCPKAAQWQTDDSVIRTSIPQPPRARGTGDSADNLRGLF